jgi:hypothetical protein
MSWSRPFDDRILLPRGRQLVTLKDAANYIQKLPKADQDLEEWQTAVEALLLVVELNGPIMMARIGIMRALNRNVERTFNSSRNNTHWGRRTLKRDQRQRFGSMSIPTRKLATSTTSRYSRRQSLPMNGSSRMIPKASPLNTRF